MRVETANGYITSYLGCYSVFTKDGALQIRTENWDDAEWRDEVGTTSGKIRSAIIAELEVTSAIEIQKINAMDVHELDEWAELLGM